MAWAIGLPGEDMTDKKSALWAIAYHEAGHAVAAMAYGKGIRRQGAAIVLDLKGAVGSVWMRKHIPGDPSVDLLTEHIIMFRSDRPRLRSPKASPRRASSRILFGFRKVKKRGSQLLLTRDVIMKTAARLQFSNRNKSGPFAPVCLP
jgi:hypothetical protein